MADGLVHCVEGGWYPTDQMINPGWSCLYIALGKGMNPTVFSPVMGEYRVWKQNLGLFKYNDNKQLYYKARLILILKKWTTK